MSEDSVGNTSAPLESKVVPMEETNGKQFDPNKYKKKEEQPPVTVLDPDHPLLQKFQKALKEHLEKQIEILSEEVFELETETKKKNAAREQLGVETYETQQIVTLQQHELDTCVKELEHVSAAREQLEHQLEEVSAKYSESEQKLLEAEKREIELRNEVEGLNLMVQQMNQWEKDIESELMINQRISEKSRKEKLKLAEEKRLQDMMVYNLTKELWKLESERDTMDMQLRVKEKEREKLAEIATRCNIDIEAFEAEYRCLLHSWNAVVVAIGLRDKHFGTLKKELDAVNEQLTNVTCEIKQVKKFCNKEMERNENLTMIKNRINHDIKNCLTQIEQENAKKEDIERNMNKMQAIIDQMNKDLQNATITNNNKKTTLSVLTKEFEKLNVQKFTIEEEILKKLQDQLTNDKAAKYLNQMLHKIKDKNRNLETTLANSENIRSKILMETESQNLLNQDLQQLLIDLQQEESVINNHLTACTDAIKKSKIIIDKRQAYIDLLSKKIDRHVDPKDSDISPQEIKIRGLEGAVEEMQEKNNVLQRHWLREQGHIVSLSEQRQTQLKDINLLRKQVMILEQKNLKIGDEIDYQKTQEDKMNRNVNNLLNELQLLNDALNKKRGSKFNLDKHNSMVQTEYINKLKDAELECLELEASIADLEEDKQSLSIKLLELNREALAWEKKLQMAVEMKQNVNEERKEGGEVGNMKAEIHRMNVRYSQLKKAQDKLIQDLEHCVSRRDAIFRLSVAREKKANAGKDSRVILKRKLTDLRNKVKQIENETAVVKRKIEQAETDESKLTSSTTNLQNDVDNYQEQTKYICSDIDKTKTDIQLKLEILTLKQKQLKVYTELLKGRKPFTLYRTQSALNTEYEIQNKDNEKLIKIVEELITDFPKQEQLFDRIYNSLHLNFYLTIT